MQKVLIIDDDPQFVDIISFQLGQFGFETNKAFTVDQATELLGRIHYDLILQDVFFPNKDDGLHMMKKIKENPESATIPVILMTSLSSTLFMQEENMPEYLNMAKELISKADNPKAIATRVKEILADTPASS